MQKKVCCTLVHQSCKNARYIYKRVSRTAYRNSTTACQFNVKEHKKDCSKSSSHTDPPAGTSRARNDFSKSSPHADPTLDAGTRRSGMVCDRVPTVGVVFDIDGVLVRGREIIKNANEALNKLNELDVPYAYLTNGGCETEEHKAHTLQQKLGRLRCTIF